jgi:hypothetical protein
VEASRAPFAAITRKRLNPFEVAGPVCSPTDGPVPEEHAFRYDGPRPQFKESAIISLADCVEATTRSLRNVRPADLHETISRIVGERIADSQLDDARSLEKSRESKRLSVHPAEHAAFARCLSPAEKAAAEKA